MKMRHDWIACPRDGAATAERLRFMVTSIAAQKERRASLDEAPAHPSGQALGAAAAGSLVPRLECIDQR
ncbi:hypothetical protein [Roseivivax sp. THAF40]|uniref:hypothetical protein n=1 Tax=Roseivivax sp. THAF40 TaxID=2587858 RepID=UPI001562CAC2|nr:hypothetical protein [Roseivivax sp. THAF40]